jgi:hypothetical protein
MNTRPGVKKAASPPVGRLSIILLSRPAPAHYQQALFCGQDLLASDEGLFDSGSLAEDRCEGSRGSNPRCYVAGTIIPTQLWETNGAGGPPDKRAGESGRGAFLYQAEAA